MRSCFYSRRIWLISAKILGCNPALLQLEMLLSSLLVLYISLLAQVICHSYLLKVFLLWFYHKVLILNLSADIKGFLTDVKPALLSALDAEYEKNPYEVYPVDVPCSIFDCLFFVGYLFQYIILQGASAVTKKTVRASESMSSVSAGGLDSLPREDISGKITPVLLKSLESPDWKVWL